MSSTFGYGNDAIFNMEDAKEKSGMNASQTETQNIATNPNQFLADNNLTLSDRTDDFKIDADADPNTIQDDFGSLGDVTTDTAQINPEGMTNVTTPINPGATTYTADTVADQLGTPETTVNAVRGKINENEDLMDTSEIEIDVTAEGEGTGVLGNALNDFASQDMSTIIDTSTIQGRLLADKLGEGNYVDSKATILGQIKILGEEFVDKEGNPVIPSWAQSMHRTVSRSMAFGDVTGTAAIRTVNNAIMEATLGIADKEAEFFQTLTTKNLDNRQQSIITKAKILASMEEANLTARQAMLKHNAQAFLDMNLANVSREQEAEVINTQERIDAIASDVAEINLARRFAAEEENDLQKFYDELDINTQMWRKEQLLNIKKFNVGEINDATQWTTELNSLQDRFEAEQQRLIDKDNAGWRREVATENARIELDIAATDVKNALDISQEALNRTWNRVDAELDYIFKGWNSESDRDAEILKTTIAAQAEVDAARGDSSVGSAIFDLASGYIKSGRGVSGAVDDLKAVGSLFGIGGGDSGDGGVGTLLDLGGAVSTITTGAKTIGSALGIGGGTAAAAGTSALGTVGGAVGSAVAAAGPVAAAILAAYGIREIGQAIDIDLRKIDLNPFDDRGGPLEIDIWPFD